MKVKTNLTSTELLKVSKGLKALAEQQTNEIVLENQAEEELMRQVDVVFDFALTNLQSEIARVLLEKE